MTATPFPVRGHDVLTFLLELAVYVAVVAAALQLPTGTPGRVAVGGVVVLAVAWGLFAAPRAKAALRGVSRVAFEVVWFGAGAVAAGTAVGWWAAVVVAVLCLLSGVLRARSVRSGGG